MQAQDVEEEEEEEYKGDDDEGGKVSLVLTICP